MTLIKHVTIVREFSVLGITNLFALGMGNRLRFDALGGPQ